MDTKKNKKVSEGTNKGKEAEKIKGKTWRVNGPAEKNTTDTKRSGKE